MKSKMLLGALFLLILNVLSGCVYVGTPQIVSFQSFPQTIIAGQPATLTWTVVGAESVNITPDVGSVALSGSRQVSPDRTTMYTLTASNSVGTASSSLTVNVTPAVSIVSFVANPPRISTGISATLQWDVVGATSVNISPEVGNLPLTGSFVVSPTSTQTYTLTAVSGTQTVSQSVTIEVAAPPVEVSLTVFPEQIVYGERTLLRWSVTGANRVRIEPDIGEVPAAGNYGVIPGQTTTYVLTAETDCCVVSRSVVVTVVGSLTPPQYGPVVELFNVTPGSIVRGGSATLEWRVTNARSVTIDQGIGPVPFSGAITVSPYTNTKYTLTVANEFAFYPVSVTLLVFEE